MRACRPRNPSGYALLAPCAWDFGLRGVARISASISPILLGRVGPKCWTCVIGDGVSYDTVVEQIEQLGLTVVWWTLILWGDL